MAQIHPVAALSQDSASISLVAPSGRIDATLLKRGEKKLLQRAYSLRYRKKNVLAQYQYFAGKAPLRARAFIEAVKDPRTSIIWCARGGYGATQLLPYFDKAKLATHIRQSKKLLIGYSDSTVLHHYFIEKAQLACLHAPMVATENWLSCGKKAEEFLFSILEGRMDLGKESYSRTWPTSQLLKAKATSGILKGGNLSVLSSLVGSKWQVSFRNSILFLEDYAEASYRLDRMLTQLANSGAFQGLRGVLVGDLNYKVQASQNRHMSSLDVLMRCFQPMNIPVVIGLPVGHRKRNEALPLGIRVSITREGKIEFLEQLVH